MSDERRIIAYEIYNQTDIPLTTAPVDRAWMDASPQRFAYRCLPLAIANQAGWLLHNPASFTAVWDGGPYNTSVHIQFEGMNRAPDANPWTMSVDSVFISAMAQARDERIMAHFGVGTITFAIPFLFRTPPGVNLWVKGPTNWIKDGVQALEGIVETDWAPSTFTMNWKLTRPNYPVHFERGEPFCMVIPVARGLAESLEPVRLPLASNAELHRDYHAWLQSRGGFLEALKQNEPEAVRRGWQRDYVHGVTPSGARAAEHQTRLALKEFRRGEAGTAKRGE